MNADTPSVGFDLAANSPGPTRRKRVTLWQRLGGGALTIAVLVHVVLLLIGFLVVFKYFTPAEKDVSFVPSGGGGGGGGERGAQYEVKRKLPAPVMPSNSVKRVFAEGGVSSVQLPDPGEQFGEISALSHLSGGGLSGGFGGAGNGSGFGNGSGNGKGNGSGLGFGGNGPKATLFGLADTRTDRLYGRIYDFTQTHDGKPTEFAKSYSRSDNLGWMRPEVTKFIERGWRMSTLEKYFQGPEKLYVHQFLIPQSVDSTAPEAFGAAGKMQGSAWIAIYNGKVCAPESGEIRFCGNADNFLVVRFDRKNVLAFDCGDERTKSPTRSVPGMRTAAAVGSWIRVTKGTWYDMSVLIGDAGGLFSAALFYERKEDESKRVLFRTQVSDNTEIFAKDKGDLPKDLQQDGPLWQCKPIIDL